MNDEENLGHFDPVEGIHSDNGQPVRKRVDVVVVTDHGSKSFHNVDLLELHESGMVFTVMKDGNFIYYPTRIVRRCEVIYLDEEVVSE